MRNFVIKVIAASLLVACGAGSSIAETPVTHLDTDAIVATETKLPVDGYLSTGQPDGAALDRLAAAGYKTVIDLRGVEEDRGIDEKSEVESRGMRYVTLPVATTDDATWDNARRLSDILADADGPVALHCYSGNRVGAMLALTSKLEGANDESALAYGKKAGLTRWEPDIAEILESSPE